MGMCVQNFIQISAGFFGFPLTLHIPTDKQTSVRPFLYRSIQSIRKTDVSNKGHCWAHFRNSSAKLKPGYLTVGCNRQQGQIEPWSDWHLSESADSYFQVLLCTLNNKVFIIIINHTRISVIRFKFTVFYHFWSRNLLPTSDSRGPLISALLSHMSITALRALRTVSSHSLWA